MRALKKVAILEHCRPYDSVDRDRPRPPLESPAPLGTEPEACDEDDGVDRMLRSSDEESNLEADHDDLRLDEDENTSFIRRKASQDEFYACDLGLRFPIL
jgi:hypothetical protein